MANGADPPPRYVCYAHDWSMLRTRLQNWLLGTWMNERRRSARNRGVALVVNSLGYAVMPLVSILFVLTGSLPRSVVVQRQPSVPSCRKQDSAPLTHQPYNHPP